MNVHILFGSCQHFFDQEGVGRIICCTAIAGNFATEVQMKKYMYLGRLNVGCSIQWLSVGRWRTVKSRTGGLAAYIYYNNKHHTIQSPSQASNAFRNVQPAIFQRWRRGSGAVWEVLVGRCPNRCVCVCVCGAAEVYR